MILMPFDTETNAIPDWKQPSDSPQQPHIVTVAALLVDGETREELDSLDLIVRPDGWEITQETIDIHGITMERAMDEGIPEKEALDAVMELWSRADLRIAHNTTFDNRIIRCAQKRFFPDDCPDHDEIMRAWKEDKALYYCTMIHARKVMGGKQPTLAEAYKHFTGNELQNAHTAMADARACAAVYWGIMDQRGEAA